MGKIVIAELDINVQAMIASVSDVKKTIDELKKSQSELTKSGDTNSKAFVENAANLKVLNSEYTAGVKALSDNTKATADQANRTELLALALNQEVDSIAQAREQNKLLNKLRNDANLSTKEGAAEVLQLNKALDLNNNFIKENADQYLKQKINIGNYPQLLNNLGSAFGGTTQQIVGFVQQGKDIAGVVSQASQAIMSSAKNIVGFGNASKIAAVQQMELSTSNTVTASTTAAVGVAEQVTTKATFGLTLATAALLLPVTLVIGILAILYATFSKLDPVMDKIEQITAAVGAAFDIAKQAVLAFVTGAKSLTEAFSGLGGSMSKAANDAAKLKEAQQDLNDALQSQEVTNARASQQYDELILKSKNRTLSDKERVAFIQQAQIIEENNYKQRTALSNAEIKQAIETTRIKGDLSNTELGNLQRNTVAYGNYLLNSGRISQAEFDALKKAELGKIEINAESTRRLEKSQNQEDKLNEDAQAKREKAQSDAVAAQEKAQATRDKAIDDSISKNEQEFALLQEKTRFEIDSIEKQKTLADEEVKILNQKLSNKRISQAQFDTEKLKIENDLKQKQTDSETAELERLKTFNDKKRELENQLELNKLTSQSEKDLLKATFDLEKHLAELETIKVNETEKNELRKLIMLEYNDQVALITENAANESLRKQGEAKVKEIEFEKAKNDLKINLAGQLGNALLSVLGDSLGAQLAAIAFDAIIQIAKMKIATASAQQINLAQATALGPILGPPALVAAGITNTALGVSSKLNQAGILASAAISGIGAVAKKKFEKGGIQEVGGNRHAQGGTKFYGEDGTTFEAEQGEGIGVLNRGAFSAFMDFNNANGGGKSTPTFMAGGGIITQGVQSQNNGIDVNAIIDIISSMPPPIVAVTEIIKTADNYTRVVEMANY